MQIAHRISASNRRKKWQLFLQAFAPTPDSSVLNVGFSDREYSPTDNFLEKHYPYRRRITALGIEEPTQFRRRYPDVDVVRYDGKRFPFADKSFDLVFCMAVIEHVGGSDRQLQFLREILRVGKSAFITTPNLYFPVEVHTRTPLLHFLPDRVFHAYLRCIGKAWATGDHMHLLSAGRLKRLLADAGCEAYQLTRNRLLGLTLDFVVVVHATTNDKQAGLPV